VAGNQASEIGTGAKREKGEEGRKKEKIDKKAD